LAPILADLIIAIVAVHPEKSAFHRIELAIEPVPMANAIGFLNNGLGAS